jgi:hypothetical protein
MSKNLTELDEFTTPITVPVGTDSRDHAAEDVELIAQRLANRTKYLNAHAAKLDAANVFTADQTVNGKLTATEVIAPKVSASTEVVTPKISSAAGDTVTVADKLTVNDTLTVSAGGATIAGPTYLAGISSTGLIFTEQYLLATGYCAAADFRYDPQRTITKVVSIYGQGADDDGATAGLVRIMPNKSVRFALSLPFDATVQRARVKVGVGDLFIHGGKATRNMDDTAGNTHQNYTGASGHNGDPGFVYSIDFTEAPPNKVTATNSFYLSVANMNATDPLDVYGIDVTYLDPGPRNH